MKDEIKEILDKLQKVANKETGSRNALMEMKDKDYQLLLDYITYLQKEVRVNNDLIPYFKNREKEFKKRITNLQQENERLKDQNINEILKKDLEICAKQYKKSDKKLDIYKSRIEKTIEYLDTLEIHEDYDNYLQPYYIEDKQNNVLDIDYLVKNIKNILNGRSDE